MVQVVSLLLSVICMVFVSFKLMGTALLWHSYPLTNCVSAVLFLWSMACLFWLIKHLELPRAN